MTPTSGGRTVRDLPRLLLRDLLGALVAASAYLLLLALYRQQTGFLSVSDDDYARVVIAQRWVLEPSWDPSATSWLPLPFLLNGSVLLVLGPSLATARLVAWVLSVGSALLLRSALRHAGLGSIGATLVALACVGLPTALPLALATVPELWTAVLVTVGALSLVSEQRSKWNWVGAICLLAATACRYETWPCAFVFSLYYARAFAKARAPRHLGLALLPLSFIATWLIHGALHHGSPLFFVKRVSDYKAALGADAPSWWELLWGYPRDLVLHEPEAFLAGAIACVVLLVRRGARDRQLSRLLLFPLAQLAFLMVGAVRGGVPTHHAERTLLAPWMILAALASLTALSGIRAPSERSWFLRQPLTIGALFVLGAGALVRQLAPKDESNWRWRASHEKMGRAIASRLPDAPPVVLDLPDYGYFAVMAAAGRPDRFLVLDDHDPRSPRNVRSTKWPPGHEYAVVVDEAVEASPAPPGSAESAPRLPGTPLVRVDQMELRQR